MPSRLPARTWLYFIAQSVNLTTAVMAVTIAALVGAASWCAARTWYARHRPSRRRLRLPTSPR